jgi:ABC-type branched-subunit amino acid transport system ATPase component
MAILVIGTIITRMDLTRITNANKEVTPVTLKITDPVDLIIDKDRQTTITTLGEMGIGKTTTLKTEGFIHKKAGHKVLPWIEIRCQEEMETDHHLLDHLTDRLTQ